MFNLAIYIILCIVSILAGKGIFRIIGIKTNANFTIFISPIVTLSFWTLFIALGITSGFNVQNLWIVGWLLTVCFAILGIQHEYVSLLIKNRLLVFLALIIPTIIMLPFVLHGITNYLGYWRSWDGWNYIVYGQYFWEYSNTSHEHLTPFYQYTSIATHFRFISSALLGFFSPLTGSPGDTQASSGYFLLYTLFVYLSSCFAFGSAFFKPHDKKILLLYGFFCTFSGMILNLIVCNNYDNLLVLPYFPAIASIIIFMDPKQKFWSILFGMLTASAIYIYIEIAPFLLISIFLFYAHQLFLDKSTRKSLFFIFLLGITITIILLLPWVHQAYIFFKNQLTAAITLRPGMGNFAQLYHKRCFMGALWGFWSPDEACNPNYRLSFKNMLGFVLTCLFLTGSYSLFKKKEWAVCFNIAIFTSALLLFLFYFEYNYGAFKIITLSWWLICIAVIYGIMTFRSFPNKILITTLSLVIFTIIGSRIITFNQTISPKSIARYKQILDIKPIIADHELHVLLNNDLATAWAFYYLRDLAPFYDHYSHPYLIYFKPNNEKTAHYSNNTYILTDEDIISSKKAINLTSEWHERPYHLFSIKNSNWVMINSITNPNGLEKWGGSDGFWVGGDKKTVIDLQAGKKGILTITASLMPGPSIPQHNIRKLLIKSNTGYEKTINIRLPSSFLVTIPAKIGNNQITISALDKASMINAEDKRIMLIGVKDLTLVDFR